MVCLWTTVLETREIQGGSFLLQRWGKGKTAANWCITWEGPDKSDVGLGRTRSVWVIYRPRQFSMIWTISYTAQLWKSTSGIYIAWCMMKQENSNDHLSSHPSNERIFYVKYLTWQQETLGGGEEVGGSRKRNRGQNDNPVQNYFASIRISFEPLLSIHHFNCSSFRSLIPVTDFKKNHSISPQPCTIFLELEKVSPPLCVSSFSAIWEPHQKRQSNRTWTSPEKQYLLLHLVATHWHSLPWAHGSICTGSYMRKWESGFSESQH